MVGDKNEEGGRGGDGEDRGGGGGDGFSTYF